MATQPSFITILGFEFGEEVDYSKPETLNPHLSTNPNVGRRPSWSEGSEGMASKRLRPVAHSRVPSPLRIGKQETSGRLSLPFFGATFYHARLGLGQV